METELQNLRAGWNPGTLLLQVPWATEGETRRGGNVPRSNVGWWLVAETRHLSPYWDERGRWWVLYGVCELRSQGWKGLCGLGVASRTPEGREGRLKAKRESDLGIVGMWGRAPAPALRGAPWGRGSGQG